MIVGGHAASRGAGIWPTILASDRPSATVSGAISREVLIPEHLNLIRKLWISEAPNFSEKVGRNSDRRGRNVGTGHAALLMAELHESRARSRVAPQANTHCGIWKLLGNVIELPLKGGTCAPRNTVATHCPTAVPAKGAETVTALTGAVGREGDARGAEPLGPSPAFARGRGGGGRAERCQCRAAIERRALIRRHDFDRRGRRRRLRDRGLRGWCARGGRSLLLYGFSTSSGFRPTSLLGRAAAAVFAVGLC